MNVTQDGSRNASKISDCQPPHCRGAPLAAAGFRMNTKTEKLGQHLVGLSLNFVSRLLVRGGLTIQLYNCTDEYLIFLLCFPSKDWEVEKGYNAQLTLNLIIFAILYLREKMQKQRGNLIQSRILQIIL